jgi:hypothetical protein
MSYSVECNVHIWAVVYGWNSPVTICITRQIPNSDPKFHQPLIVDGVGRSTKSSFATLNRGCLFRV